MVLEGQGRDRHGVRRDRAAERQAALALADGLGLGEAQGESHPGGGASRRAIPPSPSSKR